MVKTKTENLLSINTWRHLVNFWSVAIYIFIIVDFFESNALVVFLGPICTIYIGVLAIYSSQKEFERWRDHHSGAHPGEIYVIVWTLLVASLIVLEIYYSQSYKLPSEVFSTYLVVMGILAITRRSKSNYVCRLVKEK